MATCTIKDVKIEKNVVAKYMGTKIAGVQSMVDCDKDGTFSFKFEKGSKVSSSTTTTATKSFHFDFSSTVSVESTVGVEVKKGIVSASASVSIGFSATTSFGHSTTKSNSNTKDVTEITTLGASITKPAPKAGMFKFKVYSRMKRIFNNKRRVFSSFFIK